MATGKQPPRKEKTGARPHASYLKVGNGKTAAAYKAGEQHGVPGHRTYAHQPCLHAYTDGALPCPFCAAGVDLEWRAYVPLWDQDWALRYVLIGEDYAESSDVIPFRAQVKLLRAPAMKSALVIREELSFTRSLPDRAPWNAPVDMEAICLVLWKNEALSAWVKKRGPLAAPKCGPAPKRSDGKDYSPMLQGAAKKYAAPADAKPAEEEYDAIAARLRASAARLKPSKNGHKVSDE